MLSLDSLLLDLRSFSLGWLARYLPAELIGTSAALAGGLGAYALTDRPEAGAIAATAAEIAAFYLVMIARELRARGGLAALPEALRELSLEFGPAELLDGLLLRPGMLYAGTAYAPNAALGLLLGKLGADLVFYGVAITARRQLCRRAIPVLAPRGSEAGAS
jgi:hypothetical protein